MTPPVRWARKPQILPVSRRCQLWVANPQPAGVHDRPVPAPHNSADTPVMRQFLGIKANYPDSILMFRMGDFYELFFDDAVEVAPIPPGSSVSTSRFASGARARCGWSVR